VEIVSLGHHRARAAFQGQAQQVVFRLGSLSGVVLADTEEGAARPVHHQVGIAASPFWRQGLRRGSGLHAIQPLIGEMSEVDHALGHGV
jgi:hypothetical protein